jgi:hypothetical protein
MLAARARVTLVLLGALVLGACGVSAAGEAGAPRPRVGIFDEPGFPVEGAESSTDVLAEAGAPAPRS